MTLSIAYPSISNVFIHCRTRSYLLRNQNNLASLDALLYILRRECVELGRQIEVASPASRNNVEAYDESSI
jgi:hypothetical protein